jgi:hypothetical protein
MNLNKSAPTNWRPRIELIPVAQYACDMTTHSGLAFLMLSFFACGTVTPPTVDAGPGVPRPSIQGALAFDAGSAQASTQTSGGGATAGDNLSLFISDTCAGLSDQKITIYLGSRDHTKLAAGSFTVETTSSGTAANKFANVDYSDYRGGASTIVGAKSGTVTMERIDFDSLSNNAGKFDVQLLLRDGGLSQLSGSFDTRYLCR